MVFSTSSLLAVFPNTLPPEVINALLFLVLGLLVFWIVDMSMRCFTLFEGLYSFKKDKTHLIKVQGLDEICDFWSKGSVRQYLLSFLRETLESPTIPIPWIQGVFNFKEDSLKIETNQLFGRDHSKGIAFSFGASVRSSVTCYWRLEEQFFNDNLLRATKRRRKKPNDGDEEEIDRSAIDFAAVVSREDVKPYKKKSQTEEFEIGKNLDFEMDEEDHFLIVDSDKEAVEKRGFKNDVRTFFRDFKKKKKKKKKKDAKFEPISQDDLFDEKRKSELPLVIYIKALGEEKKDEESDGEKDEDDGEKEEKEEVVVEDEEKKEEGATVVAVYIICHFVDKGKRVKIFNILTQTDTGIYELSDIFGRDSDVCVVCLTEKKQVTFLPCCHWCICKRCLKKAPLETCVICRKNIDGYVYGSGKSK